MTVHLSVMPVPATLAVVSIEQSVAPLPPESQVLTELIPLQEHFTASTSGFDFGFPLL